MAQHPTAATRHPKGQIARDRCGTTCLPGPWGHGMRSALRLGFGPLTVTAKRLRSASWDFCVTAWPPDSRGSDLPR